MKICAEKKSRNKYYRSQMRHTRRQNNDYQTMPAETSTITETWPFKYRATNARLYDVI